MNTDYDHLFKIVLIGDSGVGKTSLLSRYSDNTFASNCISTIGVDFKIKTQKISAKTVKLQIWDTAGQERFRTITSGYYRGAHAIFIVFDLHSDESLQNVDVWVQEVLKYTNDALLVLLGNKADVENESSMRAEESERKRREVMEKYKMNFFYRVSAKSGEGVEKAFDEVCKELIVNYRDVEKRTNRPSLKNLQRVRGKFCCIG